MRVTIITVGSRGDAQPYVALGTGLARRGHIVTVATHEIFRPLVEGTGLAFAPIAGDPAAVVAAADHWLVTGRLRDGLAGFRAFWRTQGPLLDALQADYWRVAPGSEVLIYSGVAYPVWSVAERLGIPGIAACLQPLHRTREFPMIGFAGVPQLGARFNEATYTLAGQLAWQSQRRRLNAWRQHTLGLPPIGWRGPFAAGGTGLASAPTLYGYSPLAVRRPADWGPQIHVTGYWTLPTPRDWRPPPGLERFLDAGPPPVYMGFGSMTPRRADRLTALAVDALARTGQRGVLLSGWGELGSGRVPDTVFTARDIPHEWLFPRMQTIVHHGGSGTTGAALRSGVPQVVVPLSFDQPFWGRRVATLGVGPPPIPRHALTVERLAEALDRARRDETMRARAARLGVVLRTERGVETATALVEAYGVSAPSS
jgi:UDP:flavonoid glycosyltransferase YjiC (YdhE family)